MVYKLNLHFFLQYFTINEYHRVIRTTWFLVYLPCKKSFALYICMHLFIYQSTEYVLGRKRVYGVFIGISKTIYIFVQWGIQRLMHHFVPLLLAIFEPASWFHHFRTWHLRSKASRELKFFALGKYCCDQNKWSPKDARLDEYSWYSRTFQLNCTNFCQAYKKTQCPALSWWQTTLFTLEKFWTFFIDWCTLSRLHGSSICLNPTSYLAVGARNKQWLRGTQHHILRMQTGFWSG